MSDIALFQRHHFLLRRLHSLSGILPVGLFVMMHLFTNAQMVWPNQGETFQHEVDFIHSMPALWYVEVALWFSIGFHALLGVCYMIGWAPNVMRYPYQENWRYTLQRITAWIALVFIFLHIATLRWRWDLFGWFTPFYGHDHHTDTPIAMPLTAYALQKHWLIVVFYSVGAGAVVFHWANGLWTSAITWGVTISVAAQRRWGYVCCVLGVSLAVFMGAALYGALAYDMMHDPTPQQRVALKLIIDDWPAPNIEKDGGEQTNPTHGKSLQHVE